MISLLSKNNTKPSNKVNKKEAKEKTVAILETLAEYQQKMYAQGEKSILVVLQGVDASGKDGVINKVFGSINNMGCQTKGFGVPTKEEAAHDFLRRIHKEAPAKGMIKIFNRSHYEDLIMPLLNKQLDKKDYEHKLKDIKNFEELLTKNGTHIVKIFLHVSKEEQKRRLEERLTNKQKYRKHNDHDRDKAAKYDEYITHYENILADSTFDFAPRHIVASDENWYKKFTVAQIIEDIFKSMKLERPKLETSMHIVTTASDIKEKKQQKEAKAQKKSQKKDKKTNTKASHKEKKETTKTSK